MKGEIMTEKKTPSQEEVHKIMKLNQQSNKQFEMATMNYTGTEVPGFWEH